MIAACLSVCAVAPARAQTNAPQQPHRQFVTFAYDWTYASPLHFDKFPLEDLVGAEVDETDPPYDYRTEDGSTLIDVLEYARRGNGVGVTLYPFGMSVGATLGVRGSIQNLPTTRVRFDGPGTLDSYELTDAIAYDVGAGVFVSDRSGGWGIGSYAFLLGGVGRITSELGGGGRYFAEGGGGLQSGPFGFELSVKFGWNHLSDPVDHHFLAVPINMRATVSF
jgi:hypothetical protein